MPEMPDGHGAAFSSSLAILEGRLAGVFFIPVALARQLTFPVHNSRAAFLVRLA